MDCDDVAVLLAAAERATLTGVDETQLHNHLEDCETCRALADDRTAGDRRPVAWVPEDALADADLLVLPVVDPIVFSHPQQIAAGGMGRISRAHDRRLGRDVAIKEVLDAELRARFEREAIITARLQHPAIVPVYEAGTWPDGSAFYTMRLVSGGTLATAIARTRTIEDRLALLPHVIAVTEALAYAHSKRIIHRDLKPGNVLVGEFGETVVIDWGLAKELDGPADPAAAGGTTESRGGSADLTAIGSVLGTPGFMPPEQAAGEDLDARADVYALGAILYNLLAGTPPYFDQKTQRDSDELVEATRTRPPTPLAELAPKAPPDLRAIAERAMARDQARRYPTAREMAEQLRRFEAGQLIAREYTLGELVARWIRRHRTAVVIGALAIAALAVVATIAVRNVTRSRAAERTARRTAEASVASLLEEQGRTAVLAADHERALPYLAAAYQQRDTVAVRHLLAVATRDLDLFEHLLSVDQAVTGAIAFLPDGEVATIEGTVQAEVTRWRDGAMVATKDFGPPDGQELAFSSDGRLAAMVCNGPRFAMFDVASLAPVWQIDEPFYDDKIHIVFDPAGTRIAAMTSASGVIQVRDTRTGALIASPTIAGDDPTVDVAFSPDGGRLAGISKGGTLVVWAAPDFAPIAATGGTTGPTRLAFAGTDRIVAGTKAGTAYLFDIDKLEARALAGHYGPIDAIAVNADATMIATGDDSGAVKVWSATGDLLGEARDLQGKVAQLAFSPDGALLLGAGGSKHAQLWDVPTLGLERSIDIGADESSAIAWAPDGARFAVVGLGDARIWRAPVGSRVARLPSIASVQVGSVVVSEQGADLVVQRIETGAETLRIPAVKPAPKRIDDLWFAPGYVQVSRDARRALVRGFDAATVYDLTTGAVIAELHPEVMAIEQLWFSADGRYAMEIGVGSGELTPVRITDATTGVVVIDLHVPDAQAGDIAPDGSRAAFAAGNSPATMWRLPDGAQLPLPPFPDGPTAVRFDPTGGRLIGYGIESPVIVDTATGAVRATLVSPTPIGSTGYVDVRFDRSGRLVATWAESQTTRVWNADTGALLATFDDVAPRAYAFSADGTRFATGAGDGSVRIWETATGRLLERLQASRAAINGVAFSDDDTRLVVQSIDKFATLWDVALEHRTPAAIADLAAHGRWTLVNGLAVPRKQ